MMIVRLAVCMLILFVSLFDTRPLWAHEGHTHVMSTFTGVNDSQLVVSNTSGQTITIQLDRHTRYRATDAATIRATVRVGDRVVVEVTEEANGLHAAEVRYAAVAPKTPSWIGRQLDGWTRIVHRDLVPGLDDGGRCTGLATDRRDAREVQ